MMRFLVAAICCVSLLAACNSGPASIQEIFPKQVDLIEYGVPLKVQAPNDVVVTNNGDETMKEVLLKGGDFYVQLYGSATGSGDCKTVTERELAAVKEKSNFSKIVEQNDCGFIYEQQYEGDTTKYYNFKAYAVKGANQFSFETTTVSPYTLEQVRNMFKAVQASEAK